ncbi:MAG: TraR/DksA C4-type zinc finger protein [Nitrospirota bacterium]|nr:MAG: TraR/DksA C4-type zinc finger protein [Nitrospirota bacterium]
MAVKKKSKAKKSKQKKTAKKKVTSKKTVKKKKVAKAKKTVKKAAKKTAKKKAKTTSKRTAKSAKPSPAVKTVKKKTTKRSTARDKKIDVIRERLVDQRNQLISDAEAALANELPGQILFPDLGDQASAEIDRNFMLRLKGREQKLLTKIEGVLEAIDSGEYGICESCGADIGIKRLEARPVTSMCIECKTEQEEEERLRE